MSRRDVGERLVVALAGNPNTGKTTVFNHLTGSHQHVGNWPGKTVDRKSGWFRRGPTEVEIVDLPGTYSLVAASTDERIAREALVEGEFDAVVAVVDAANLERNLYLVAQIRELGAPVVVALNMTDVAAARGVEIDADRLGLALGAVVVPTVARTGTGVDRLADVIIGVARRASRALA
ncbi:MAG TPA: FeoB small GTPase domain-containing protein [Acidimicrobiales bacterium]|nr:FeoB small GTPase domain-containing protein [Acidimicrobiales bacterium]